MRWLPTRLADAWISRARAAGSLIGVEAVTWPAEVTVLGVLGVLGVTGVLGAAGVPAAVLLLLLELPQPAAVIAARLKTTAM
ncbi:MAG TPA: hypothetical protein VMU90_07940 [Solirubrobacteraceae bacterium]|nr:hypothetical protein [Solirubrobacteraceae bacterium]